MEVGLYVDARKVRNEVMKRDKAACPRPVRARPHYTGPRDRPHREQSQDEAASGSVKTDDRSDVEAICKPCHEVKTEAEQGKAEAVRKTLAMTVGQREVREDTLLLLSTRSGRSYFVADTIAGAAKARHC